MMFIFNSGLPGSISRSQSRSTLWIGFVDVFILFKYINLHICELSLPCIYILFFKKCLTHSPMSPAFNAFNSCNYHIFMIYLSTEKLNKQYWSTSSSLVSKIEIKFIVWLFTSGRVCFLELWLNHTESNHINSKEQKACRLLHGIASTVP